MKSFEEYENKSDKLFSYIKKSPYIANSEIEMFDQMKQRMLSDIMNKSNFPKFETITTENVTVENLIRDGYSFLALANEPSKKFFSQLGRLENKHGITVNSTNGKETKLSLEEEIRLLTLKLTRYKSEKYVVVTQLDSVVGWLDLVNDVIYDNSRIHLMKFASDEKENCTLIPWDTSANHTEKATASDSLIDVLKKFGLNPEEDLKGWES